MIGFDSPKGRIIRSVLCLGTMSFVVLTLSTLDPWNYRLLLAVVFIMFYGYGYIHGADRMIAKLNAQLDAALNRLENQVDMPPRDVKKE